MSAPVLYRPNPLDQAMRLLSFGFSVIPIKTRDKRPALPSWKEFQTRRATIEEVRGWFANPDLNVGIVTGGISGVVVVDADNAESAAWLAAHHPSPMRTKTGKGAHYWFRHPGVPIKNTVKLGGRQLDIRADGGYVVAPGSVHPSGALYEEDGDWGPAAGLPQFQPAWLGQRVIPIPKAPSSDRIRLYLEATPGAIQGEGGDAHTFRVACKLVRGFDLTDDQALAYLQTWNAKCLPPWSDAELRTKIQSARQNGTEPFGGRAAEGHHAAPATVDEGGEGNLQDLLSRTKDGKVKRTPGNLAKILRLDPQFGACLRLNEMSREVSYKGQVCGEPFIDWVQEWIEDHHGVAFGREEVSTKIAAEAAQHPFHPVRDWLQSLKWDRVERISHLAARVLGNPDALPTHYLRCTLVGAVRRVMLPGTKLDTLPVLEGAQGLGKSTFWAVLFGAQWFGDSPLDLDSKDGFMVLHRRWATEIAELDHLTSAKAAERIKAFLSSSEDLFRPPFGRTVQAFPRSCCLVGTTNREAFLADPTGSRRFWPIHCNSIDLDTLQVWREQIWAEAKDLEVNGADHWLTQTQETLRVEDAERFTAEDPWESLWAQAVDGLRAAGRFPSDGYTQADLMTQMGIQPERQDRRGMMRLAEIMRKAGWRSWKMRRGGNPVWVWGLP